MPIEGLGETRMSTAQGTNNSYFRHFLLALVTVVIGLFSAHPAFAATVKTDKIDYMPGDSILITGLGWQALEQVNMTFHATPTLIADFTTTATADSNGQFSVSIPAPALPGLGFTTLQISISATGQNSGRTAGTFFWDGLSKFVPVTGSLGALCNTPGAAGCATATPLAPYSGDKYRLPVRTAVTSTIVDAKGSVAVFGLPANEWGACTGSNYAEPVRVFIKSPLLGTAEVCGSRDANKNITFTFDPAAPAPLGWGRNGCQTAIVANAKDGPDPSGYFNTSNDVIFDGLKDSVGQPGGGGVLHNAGYAFTDPITGALASCAAVVTEIHKEPDHAVTTSVVQGSTVHDSALATGLPNIGIPTGQASFTFYGNKTCSGGDAGVNAGTVAFVNGIAHPSSSFGPLTPGGYSFQAVYTPDANSPYAGVVAACEPLDVTVLTTASLGDRVWNDQNGNGIQDSGEPGLVGVTVTLIDAINSNTLGSTTTGANGIYVFSGLSGGNYKVCTSNLPAGFVQTYDLDGLATPNCATANLAPGENRTDVDFGYHEVREGGFVTYTQGGWGAPPNGNNPGMLLSRNFSTVYPNGVTIGGNFTQKFTSAAAIEKFLPAGGTPGVLKANYVNPTKATDAGSFNGQVLALQLSVDFSNAGKTKTGLANLKLTSTALQGKTVAEVLALANQVLGGGPLPAGMTVSNLNDIVTAINENFDNGTTNKGLLQ